MNDLNLMLNEALNFCHPWPLVSEPWLVNKQSKQGSYVCIWLFLMSCLFFLLCNYAVYRFCLTPKRQQHHQGITFPFLSILNSPWRLKKQNIGILINKKKEEASVSACRPTFFFQSKRTPVFCAKKIDGFPSKRNTHSEYGYMVTNVLIYARCAIHRYS